MRTVQGLALSLSALALASSGCARSDLARKAHDGASTAPPVGNDDTNDAVDADEGEDEGASGDDEQGWDGDDDPALEDDAGTPGNHGPMCPARKQWRSKVSASKCAGSETGASRTAQTSCSTT